MKFVKKGGYFHFRLEIGPSSHALTEHGSKDNSERDPSRFEA